LSDVASGSAQAAAAAHPIIGISMYHQDADWGTWRQVQADLLPAAYAESVSLVGGVPVLIPVQSSAEAARAVVSRLDGLIIAGGADVNPSRYGQEPNQHVTVWYDERDETELWLLDAASDAALPVLGICRGMQVMAVHAGGSLVQHLPDALGHARHAGTATEYGDIGVTVEPGHRISELVDPSVIAPCHHHQAVTHHPGYVATARDDDGVLQAMEAEGDRFEVAVQWHPETAADKRLFGGLVQAARRGIVAV
jgi:putative glutamine amidotransferase